MAELTANQKSILGKIAVLSQDTTTLFERSRISQYLGMQYGGDRDLYTSLGWKKDPVYNDYISMYRRHEIAKAAINAPVTYCWESFPVIEESDESDTEFERSCANIVTKFRLQRVFTRLDILASLGKYAVLLLGFKDGTDSLKLPAGKAEELAFVTPYPEGSVTIKTTVSNPQDPRFGQPEIFSIKMGPENNQVDVDVHFSRVLYVAQECLDNPLVGTPQLEVIFNRLYDIEKTVGGDAEAFWRLVFAGIMVSVDKEFEFGAEQKENFEAAVEQFIHNMKRFITLQGATATPITQQVADPKSHFDMQIAMVSAGKSIPKRILLGAELGELASTMDYIRWLRQVQLRREQFCESDIIRPFFDRLIEVGIVKRSSNTTERYNVKWNDLLTPSDKDKAEVGDILARALSAYLNSGGDSRVPLEIFLEWLGRSPEEIEKIKGSISLDLTDDPDLIDPPDSQDAGVQNGDAA